MNRKPGIRAFTSASRLAISLLVVCAAAGCAPDRGHNVEATGTAAAAPIETTTTTTVPPTTAPVELPVTTVTLPPVTTPRPTTTSRPLPRPTTTTLRKVPPATVVRRPAAYAAANGTRPDYGYVIPITAAGTAGKRIPVGGSPTGIAVTADGGRALVSNLSGYVSVIDTDTSTLRATIPVCSAASGIVVTPDAKTAFVTCNSTKTVQPINLVTGRGEPAIGVGNGPLGITITPDGKTIYVVNFNGENVTDVSGSVTPIDVASRTTGTPLKLGGPEAEAATVTPDGRTLIVGVRDYAGQSSVHYIDRITNRHQTTRPACSMPSSIAVRPDSAVAYISCRQTGGILEVNLAKPAEPTRTLPISSQAVALSPAGTVLYSAGGIWGGSTVDIIDTGTMKACGYVAAEGPAAVATVPGIVPDLGCVPKPGG